MFASSNSCNLTIMNHLIFNLKNHWILIPVYLISFHLWGIKLYCCIRIHINTFIYFNSFFFPLYICKDLSILTSNICAIKSLKTVSSFCFIFSIRSISQLRNSCLSKSPSYEQRKRPSTNSQCTCIQLFSCNENMCDKIFTHSCAHTHVQNV